MTNDFDWRFSLIAILVSFAPILIVVRLVGIELNPKQAEKFMEEEQLYSREYHVVYPARGQVYDRWGNVIAANKLVYEVGIELQDVRNPQTIAASVSSVLGLDYEKILAIASLKPSETAVYAVVTDNVAQDKVDLLDQMKNQMVQDYKDSPRKHPPSLSGLVYTAHLQRTYPEKSLGSNFLGFVSREGKGYFGVEEKYNELLAGTPKTVLVPLDPNQVDDTPVIPDGASVILTIDRELQNSMEQILDSAILKNGAKSGTLIVLDPKSGEILALATTPRIDLNEYWHYSEVFPGSTPFNRAVSQAYEPGSVFKVLTMGVALDTGTVKPETKFVDTGSFEIGGTIIHNWNGGAWGPQDMIGCLQHSLNVCLAWVASQTGAKNFYSYMQSFGIGRLTGVDMAGEAAGRLKIPGDADWYDADLGTNSFGQGVSATPLQMAVAVSAVANDGKIMAPHIVRSIVNKGYQHDIEQRVIAAPIRADTAHTESEMLARSLEGESSVALVSGYRVAGKTGTAQIPTPGGYTKDTTNTSFVGWGPVDDPKFLVYIWLEEPTSNPWGSVVAAPVFSEAVSKIVTILGIPPDTIRKSLPK